LAFYARVEAGIGVYALSFPILFGFVQKLSLLGPLDHDALGFAVDIVLSALLIGPPAVLMGGTIPILTLALAGDLARATRGVWTASSGRWVASISQRHWPLPR
jgi:hypothetical protein